MSAGGLMRRGLQGCATVCSATGLAAVILIGALLSPAEEAATVMSMSKIDSQWVNVVVACVSGMFGSIVSLLMRISEFESTRGRSQMFLKLTGATLPIVGGTFGAFVGAVFCAKIVNISIGAGGFSVWAFVAIGFLSGFSERFSRGFVTLAEARLGAAEQSTQVSIAANAQVTESDGATKRTRGSARGRTRQGARAGAPR